MHPLTNTPEAPESKLSPWEQAKREFSCEHIETTRYVTFTDAIGRISYRRQCVRCGANLGDVKKIHVTPAIERGLVPWNEETRTRWDDARVARGKELAGSFEEERKEEFQREFDERHQLATSGERWQRLRVKIFARCKGVCEGCGDVPATVVHHRHYKRLGKELLFDLVGLCRSCHDVVHDRDEGSVNLGPDEDDADYRY